MSGERRLILDEKTFNLQLENEPTRLVYLDNTLESCFYRVGMNTWLYYKFDNNLNDSSLNNTTLSDDYIANLPYSTDAICGSSLYKDTNNATTSRVKYTANISPIENYTTVSFWFNSLTPTAGSGNLVRVVSSYSIYYLAERFLDFRIKFLTGMIYVQNRTAIDLTTTTGWNHICVAQDWSNYGVPDSYNIYFNGEYSNDLSGSRTPTLQGTNFGDKVELFGVPNFNTSLFKMDQLIIENRVWSHEEVKSYYNVTKLSY